MARKSARLGLWGGPSCAECAPEVMACKMRACQARGQSRPGDRVSRLTAAPRLPKWRRQPHDLRHARAAAETLLPACLLPCRAGMLRIWIFGSQLSEPQEKVARGKCLGKSGLYKSAVLPPKYIENCIWLGQIHDNHSEIPNDARCSEWITRYDWGQEGG